MPQQASGESEDGPLAIMSQSEAAHVDHGADIDDFDSVRYVPDALAGDSYVPNSFVDRRGRS
jgi:hypothetical protein